MKGRTALLATVLLLSVAPSSIAQETPTVSLEALDPRVEHPTRTKLTGAITPATDAQPVEIWTSEGLQTAVTTAADGTFGADLFLDSNDTVYAMWGSTQSPPVEIQVRPVVDASFKGLRLFGKARLVVQVEPPLPGGTLRTTLVRNGKAVGVRKVPIERATVRTSMKVLKPGLYHYRVAAIGPDNAPGRDRTRSLSPSLQALGEGSRGIAVKLLEKRLMNLNYHLDGADQVYDYRTSDAIRAFNKVNNRPRLGNVDEGTLRAIGNPFTPRPAAKGPKFHIEVDQTKQVLYVVRKGKIDDIIHVSTGAGYATRDGVFHFHRKLAGYSGNRLYYPSYFDGLRAIHGWPEVPTYNASHGCVRVPYWTAQWIFGLTEIGDEIRIYH